MSELIQHKEFSARYGLKQAIDDVDTAQMLAEAKYRTLVGREIFFSEMNDIHQLIGELRGWTGIPKVVEQCQLPA